MRSAARRRKFVHSDFRDKSGSSKTTKKKKKKNMSISSIMFDSLFYQEQAFILSL